MLKLTKNFYINGFQSINPDNSTVFPTNKGKFSFTITHNQASKDFITELYYTKGDAYEQQPNPCWVDKNLTSTTLICFINFEGSNKLYLYGSNYGQDQLPLLLEYDVIVSKNSADRQEAPQVIKSVLQDKDFHLIKPMYNPLKRGGKLKFIIRSRDFGNMYIINSDDSKNNHHYRELDYSSGKF